MARSTSNHKFPWVPVAIGAGVGLVAVALLKSSAGAANAAPAGTLPKNPNDIPVLANAPGGAVAALQTGQRFSADLSGTLLGSPASRAPTATFQALGPVSQTGVAQDFEAYVPAMNEQTSEMIIPGVPLSKIKSVLS